MPFYTIQPTPAPSISHALAAAPRQPVEPDEPPSEDPPTVDENELPSYDSLIGNNSTFFRPQSIVIDRSLIFPSEPPSNALYQLNHDLDSGNTVTIGRIDHTTTETPGRAPRTRVRDRPIYTFSHRIFNDSFIELAGKRKDGFTFVLMVKKTSLRGPSWKVCSSTASTRQEGPIMLRCKPVHAWFSHSHLAFKWIDAGGKTIAIEGRDQRHPKNVRNKEESEYSPSTRQMLNILEPLEQKALDILVTAWCARVWHDALDARKAPLTPNEGTRMVRRLNAF